MMPPPPPPPPPPVPPPPPPPPPPRGQQQPPAPPLQHQRHYDNNTIGRQHPPQPPPQPLPPPPLNQTTGTGTPQRSYYAQRPTTYPSSIPVPSTLPSATTAATSPSSSSLYRFPPPPAAATIATEAVTTAVPPSSLPSKGRYEPYGEIKVPTTTTTTTTTTAAAAAETTASVSSSSYTSTGMTYRSNAAVAGGGGMEARSSYTYSASTTPTTTGAPSSASSSMATVGNYPYMSTTATTSGTGTSDIIKDFTMGTMTTTNTAEHRRRSSASMENKDNMTLNRSGNNNSSSSGNNYYYSHNGPSVTFLLSTLVSILWVHDDTPLVMEVFLFVVLVLYGMDLMNARDGVAVGVWVGTVIMTMATAFGTLLQVDDDVTAGGTGKILILFLGRLAVEGMLYCSWACWITLQFHWLYKEVPSLAIGMERSLHSLLPPVSASILTYHISRLLMDYWGLDRAATASSFIFAALMAMSMLAVGTTYSSFEPVPSSASSSNNNNGVNSSRPNFSIPTSAARIHTMLLLLVPGFMHILTFRRRIFSRYASFDELYDLLLVWTVPYLFQCLILSLPERSPYSLPKGLYPLNAPNSTLRGTLVPMVATVVASIAAQQRYVIPLCNAVSYQFHGHDLPSTVIVTLYLTSATLSSLFAIWVWGRRSTITNEPLFGDYHDDIVQLAISAAGMLLGKAFGFPWNMTPLPILSFLGLSVWLTTRMLRYLCIFLFVVHAAGVVVFSYRFASIGTIIPLAVPHVQLGLVRFGMIEVFGSVIIGLFVGFVARPSGGFGSSLLKRIDVPGFLLIVYTVLLTVMESTLLRRRRPNDLVGREYRSDVDVEDTGFMYDHATAWITGGLVVAIAVASRRYLVISQASTIATISLVLGKVVAVIIDASEGDNKVRTEHREEVLAQRLLFRALVASAMIGVMVAPRALLNPIHIKNSARYKRTLADGRPLSSIPASSYRIMALYCLIVLPVTLVASVPSVLSPLVMALSTHYNGGAYYRMAPPVSEMIGFGLTLWGIASLSTLNYCLPDGGAETWKKASALTLLMGIGVAWSAPAVPEWIMGDIDFGISNPYAAISSLGSQLANQSQSRSGGWGVLSAFLATLLAITGPLDLRERRSPSGRKDQTLFLRLMMFSLMFGSGVSWFITIQCMGGADFLSLILTLMSCMAVSFFGTVTCVLGYFVELENFDEVDQMSKLWAGSFFFFYMVTCGPPILIESVSTNLLGSGGSLSTFLLVTACVTLSFTVAVQMRSTKNQSTRGLGNLSCIFAYGCAAIVLYGRFGVAGLDRNFGVAVIMGVPASLFGTICIAPILLGLESESSSVDRRGNRVSRVAMGGTRTPKPSMGITLKNLNSSNRFVPVIAGIVAVFYLAGLYSIFLRGSLLLGTAVPTNHEEVLSSIIGRNRDTLASMAQKATSYSEALIISARLAGSGFWTAGNFFGPLIHLGGIVATVPSMYLFLSQMLLGSLSSSSKAQVVFALPFNIFTLLFCKGTPTIQAVAVIGTVGGLMQLFVLQQRGRRARMRI